METITGFIEHRRKQKVDGKPIVFATLSTGGMDLKRVQVVAHDQEMFKSFVRGCFVHVTGEWVESIGTGQKKEFVCKAVSYGGSFNLSKYPIPKAKLTFEHLRKHPQFSPRTMLIQSIMKIRHFYKRACDAFFETKEAFECDFPVLTKNDCEGGGETICIKDPTKLFSHDVYLTVSRQLMLESYVPMGNVYTRGSCMRAEKSNTSRHLIEFDMLEFEGMAFDLKQLMDFCEEQVQFIIQFMIGKCQKELEFIAKFTGDTGLIDRLKKISETKFKKISYTEAIDYFHEHKDDVMSYIKKMDPSKCHDPFIQWGDDMSSIYEKCLTLYYDGPLIVHSYPRAIKSFYMKLSKDGKTVQGCDVLVPGIGELIGGSVRESDIRKILLNTYSKTCKKISDTIQNEIISDPAKFMKFASKRKIQEVYSDEERAFFKLVDDLGWYFQLRLFGGQESAGYGMGSERMLMLLTGIKNIRDVTTFYRCPGSCFA
jgi:asparaginyl-tRNA synthetase